MHDLQKSHRLQSITILCTPSWKKKIKGKTTFRTTRSKKKTITKFPLRPSSQEPNNASTMHGFRTSTSTTVIPRHNLDTQKTKHQKIRFSTFFSQQPNTFSNKTSKWVEPEKRRKSQFQPKKSKLFATNKNPKAKKKRKRNWEVGFT